MASIVVDLKENTLLVGERTDTGARMIRIFPFLIWHNAEHNVV